MVVFLLGLPLYGQTMQVMSDNVFDPSAGGPFAERKPPETNGSGMAALGRSGARGVKQSKAPSPFVGGENMDVARTTLAANPSSP